MDLIESTLTPMRNDGQRRSKHRPKCKAQRNCLTQEDLPVFRTFSNENGRNDDNATREDQWYPEEADVEEPADKDGHSAC